jgi:hypothetical protein
MAHEYWSGVMCAVRTEVLQAGQVSEESVVGEYVIEVLRFNRCGLLL